MTIFTFLMHNRIPLQQQKYKTSHDIMQNEGIKIRYFLFLPTSHELSGKNSLTSPCVKVSKMLAVHVGKQATVFLKTLLDFLVHLHQKAEALALGVL